MAIVDFALEILNVEDFPQTISLAEPLNTN